MSADELLRQAVDLLDDEEDKKQLTAVFQKLKLDYQEAAKALTTATRELTEARDQLEHEVQQKETLQHQLAQLGSTPLDYINWTSATSINAFLTDKTPTDLSERFRLDMLSNRIEGELRFPSFDDEMAYSREYGDKELLRQTLQDGVKALSKVPVFTGEGDITWSDFEHHMRVAVMNRNLPEHVLRQQLPQHLGKKAFSYYRKLPKVLRMTFSEVMDALKKRYENDSTTASNLVRTVKQSPDEDVLDYSTRMKVAAEGMQPRMPSELMVWTAEGKRYIMPNPRIVEDEEHYQKELKAVEDRLTPYFLAGLLPEIQAKLNSNTYTDFSELELEAKNAQWMCRRSAGDSSAHLHHLQNHEEVNALSRGRPAHRGAHKYGRGRGRSQYGQTSSRFGQTSSVRCYRCGKEGHMKKNCPDNVPYFTPQQRPSSTVRPSPGTVTRRDFNNLMHSAVTHALKQWSTKKGEKKRPRRQVNALDVESDNDELLFELDEDVQKNA
jgi:hypothetical protein